MSKLVLLVLVALSFPIWAQKLAQASAEPSATVTGVVLDPSGAAVSGAQVSLVLADGTILRTTTTDSAGAFRLSKVEPGTYGVHVEASGFQPRSQTVIVDSKPSSPLRINLVIASQNQTVNVGGQDASVQVTPDVVENRNANSIDREALDRVPVFDQDYVATLSRFLDDSAIGTNGVALVVNGLEANGPGVTASAVQEVKINQNPYSALFSRPGRARLEIVTKGGTPDFHGTVNFLFRNSVFDARNTFAEQSPQSSGSSMKVP